MRLWGSWERLSQGWAWHSRNKTLSFDYFKPNDSPRSDTLQPSLNNSNKVSSVATQTHTDNRAPSENGIHTNTPPPTYLCCIVHNTSCFIKAKSHPLSVHKHRSRLNRQGNTIPFQGYLNIWACLPLTGLLLWARQTPTIAQYCSCSIAPQIGAHKVISSLYMSVYVCVYVLVCWCVGVLSTPWYNSFPFLISPSVVSSRFISHIWGRTCLSALCMLQTIRSEHYGGIRTPAFYTKLNRHTGKK